MSERTPQQAYTQLQKVAREQERTTQQLFELYIHERFLARLASSEFAQRFVLKGGMLLATMNARRSTRDADMLARDINNDDETLRRIVSEIARLRMGDGVNFDTSDISTQPIREEADYQGVRVTLPAGIGGAKLKLKLDLSFGDPVMPEQIRYPTLLDDEEFTLLGYSIYNVIAEKAETMMFLGDANTRDRDFGDVYVLSSVHELDATTLRNQLLQVGAHRDHELRELRPLLRALPDSRQQPWEAFRARAALPALPERFADVVHAVADFIDPLLGDDDVDRWNPAERRWV